MKHLFDLHVETVRELFGRYTSTFEWSQELISKLNVSTQQLTGTTYISSILSYVGSFFRTRPPCFIMLQDISARDLVLRRVPDVNIHLYIDNKPISGDRFDAFLELEDRVRVIHSKGSIFGSLELRRLSVRTEVLKNLNTVYICNLNLKSRASRRILDILGESPVREIRLVDCSFGFFGTNVVLRSELLKNAHIIDLSGSALSLQSIGLATSPYVFCAVKFLYLRKTGLWEPHMIRIAAGLDISKVCHLDISSNPIRFGFIEYLASRNPAPGLVLCVGRSPIDVEDAADFLKLEGHENIQVVW